MEKRQPPVSAPLAVGLATGVVVAAAMIGKRSSPTPDHPRTRHWFRRLAKPGFTPPSPAYGIAWTGIQAGLAFGGYRLLRASPSSARSLALSLWTANQVGIAGWSAIFFGRRAPGAGTVASASLGLAAVGYVATADRVDRPAAAVGLPLALWVGFATLLAEEIWRRNDA